MQDKESIDPAANEAASDKHVRAAPHIPDHELLRRAGRGSYGEVWLARNAVGTFRAVKVVYRDQFDNDKPYDREFEGLKRFEPISRRHKGVVEVLHLGRNDSKGYFYYIMEVADDVAAGQKIVPAVYQPLTLNWKIQSQERLPLHDCFEIGLALADG